MTIAPAPDSRYTVISADAHAGGDIQDYRPYLASRWHDEFDAWAAAYVNPYADLQAPTAYRSWDSERRLAENDADGIAAEVLFPNTVPPFFEEGSLLALPPSAADYERLATRALDAHRGADGLFLSARGNLLDIALGLEASKNIPVVEQVEATLWWALSKLGMGAGPQGARLFKA